MKGKTVLTALGCVCGCALTLLSLCACGKDDTALQDGYFTAQAADPSYGWREYVTIMVKEGKIVATEYNAINDSGLVKSWDNAYMQNMLPVSGTYPNAYTRYYASQLTGAEGEVEIDALSGATSSHAVFQALVSAVIDQARKGDSSVIQVPTAGLYTEEEPERDESELYRSTTDTESGQNDQNTKEPESDQNGQNGQSTEGAESDQNADTDSSSPSQEEA